MIRRHGEVLRLALMLADGGSAVLLSLLLYQWVAHPDAPTADFLNVFWVRGILYGVAWVALLYVHGAYRLRAHWTIFGEVGVVARATFWLALLGTVALFLSAREIHSSGWVLLLFPVQGLFAVVVRVAARITLMHFRRQGHNVRNLVVLGTGPEAMAFTRLLHEHSVLGVKVVGYLGDDPSGPTGAIPAAAYWGPISALPHVLHEQVVDEVAVCVRQGQWHVAEEYAQMAHEEGKLIRVPLNVPQLRSSERFLEELDGTAVLSYANSPDELTSLALKRSIDLVVAISASIVAAPFVLALIVVMRIAQGREIIFKQARVGMHGRVFTIYKFRTMVDDAEDRYAALADQSDTNGPAFKLVDDPRVTAVGRWLRRFSLDELPQLWNVIKGNMSIVGPRPAPGREVEAYDLWHRRRLSMKPGITGLWQVTSRLDRDFDRRAELDMTYIDNWSIWLDVTILLRTVPAMIRGPGL